MTGTGSLLAALAPLALGAAMSPLAVVAVVVVLLSRRPGPNGVAFLVGWTAGILVVLALGVLLAVALAGRSTADPPLWLDAVRILVGVVLIGGAIITWRRKHAAVRAMARAEDPAEVVAAAPQLPGWLHSVETFQPARCVALGMALFVVNPVDFACGLGAGVDLAVAEVSTGGLVLAGVLFLVVAMLPVAVPVGLYLVRGSAADPLLQRMKSWIAGHNGLLNAALLLVIGVLQLVKGLQGL